MNEVRKKDGIGKGIYMALVATSDFYFRREHSQFFAKCDATQ